MRIRNISTSMWIALTILFAGIVVQVTDALELFGHNSAIPVIIGLVIIVVGLQQLRVEIGDPGKARSGRGEENQARVEWGVASR